MPGSILVTFLVALLIGGALGLVVGRLMGLRTGTARAEQIERQLRRQLAHAEGERDRIAGTRTAPAAAVPGPVAPPEAAAPSPAKASAMPGTPHADTHPAPDSPATEEVDTEAGGGPGDGARPPRLDGPEDGRADDLKAIDGIGPKLEAALNAEGIYHFRQLAELTADQIAWLDRALGLRGRPVRDDWVGQAKARLGGG